MGNRSSITKANEESSSVFKDSNKMAAAHDAQKNEKRYVKGLLLADTLGKGTFGYVKLGIKESTGQQFAMKFLMKNNRRFKEEQVKTEIDCMKRINHPNVIRLLHADYNCN